MKQALSMRALIALLLALAFGLAACGDDDADDGGSAAVEEEATDEGTDEGTDDAAEGDDAAAGGGGIGVDLGNPDAGEFTIILDGEVTAGTVTFDLTNSGEFPHTLAVARGDAYENLPLKDNGGVDTDALGDDFLGATDANLGPGETGTLTLDLEAGDYVFFCPVQNDTQSHAGAGQVLSVTVG